jgi:biopolymer transport protein ExbD
MLRRYFLKVTLCLLLITMLLAPACTGKTSPNLPEPDYAGQMAENILLAINGGDYSAFSMDFDASMIKALPAESFKAQFSQGIQGKIGNYVPGSKRFFQASSQAQFTTVVYYAVYSGDPGAVLVQISFKMVEGKPLVSGLFFNSPKLRS